jgi:lysophospholipase L1-like esterase
MLKISHLKTSALILFSIGLYLILTLVFPYIYSGYLFKTTPPAKLGTELIRSDSTNTKKYAIAAIGDSTALGQGSDSVHHSFSYQYTEKYLSDPNIEYTNYAVSGARVNDVIAQQLNFEKVDLVFVSIGANDVTGMTTVAEYQKSVTILATKLQALAPKVIWLNIPDFITVPVLLPPLREYLSYQSKNLNDSTREIIESHGCSLINVYDGARDDFMQNQSVLYSRDKYHPSAEGYGIWVELIKTKNR